MPRRGNSFSEKIQTKSMDIRITPVSMEHMESLHDCLDSVARERRFIAFLQAPPREEFRKFVLGNLLRNIPHFVAVERDMVVGWCDIIPHRMEGFTHVGKLGIGVRRDWRGRGIGSQLLAAAMDRAREKRLERIELEVFASNENAIALYRKIGFEVEGTRRKARKIDGVYDDIIGMALFFNRE